MTARAVRVERGLNATTHEVWDALTAPEQLAGWLGRGVLEPFVGGRVDLITAGPGGGRVVGAVRQYDPPQVLELTWRFENELETVLRIELQPGGGKTLLRLSHTDLPAELHHEYQQGWSQYADALARQVGAQREAHGAT